MIRKGQITLQLWKNLVFIDGKGRAAMNLKKYIGSWAVKERQPRNLKRILVFMDSITRCRIYFDLTEKKILNIKFYFQQRK